MENNYISLHVHSDYSFLDSVAKLGDLANKARKLNMPALALTDHGNVCGWLKFYEACVAAKDKDGNPKSKIKPIFGIEAYICEDSKMISKLNNKIDECEILLKTSNGPLFDGLENDYEKEIDNLKQEKKKHRKASHVIILAKNKQGYKNILRLSSYGFQEGFYSKPRIDMQILEKHKEGLVVLSGCLGGLVSKNIMNKDFVKAEHFLKEYKRIFGEDFYLEFQLHDIQEQKDVNKKLLEYMDQYKVEPVITQDVHYVEKEDIMAHEVIIKLRNSQKSTDSNTEKINTESKNADETTEAQTEEGDGYFFTTRDLYFKTYEEMSEARSSVHGYMSEETFKRAMENTLKINDKIEFIDVRSPKPILPEYDTAGKSAREFILDLIKKGIKERFGDRFKDDASLKDVYQSRIKEELNTICDLGFEQYFLIEWDLMKWCKDNNVMTGPGRGSAAGSLIAYCLGITQLDPIEHKLLFSRFINKSRSSARYKLEFPEFPMKKN